MEHRCRMRFSVFAVFRTILLSSVAWGVGALDSGRAQASPLDLRRAVIVCPAQLSKPERKALDLLLEEVQKRTRVRWELAHGWPADSIPVLAVGPVAQLADFAGRYLPKLAAPGQERAAEGFRIRIEKDGRTGTGCLRYR